MSDCRRQIRLVIIAPHRERLIRILDTIWLLDFLNIEIIRRIPYPPSFRRMAASTIDPAIGASTWAFGNHKCTENIGSFTKNPRIIRSQIYCVFIMKLGEIQLVGIDIDLCPEVYIRTHKITSIGREAVTVYIIKYMLACMRSGW